MKRRPQNTTAKKQGALQEWLTGAEEEIVIDSDSELVARLLSDAETAIQLSASSTQPNENAPAYALGQLERAAHWLLRLRPSLVAIGFPDLAQRAAVAIADAIDRIRTVVCHRQHLSEIEPGHWQRQFQSVHDKIGAQLANLSLEFAAAARMLKGAPSVGLTETTPNLSAPRLTLDPSTQIATLDGVSFSPLPKGASDFLQSLIEAKGGFTRPAKNSGIRQDRLRKQLPEAIQQIIDSKKGPSGGARLLIEGAMVAEIGRK